MKARQLDAIERYVFVDAGREAELQRLRTLLTQVLAGHPQVVLISGDAGFGKTTLVHEFCRHAIEANDKLVVAWGQCNIQFGPGEPYLPFKEILDLLAGNVEGVFTRRAITRKNVSRLQQLLGHTGEAIVELGPDLVGALIPAAGLLMRASAFLAKKVGWLKGLEKLAHKPFSRDDFKPEQLFEQFSRVIVRLTEHNPLILTLDDLHWADFGTLDLFFYLSRRMQQLEQTPLLLIGMYRPAEVKVGRDGKHHPLEKIINEVRRYWRHPEIDLSHTIGGQAGRAFLNGFLDTEPNRLQQPFREVIFRRAEGHPLFTIELLRNLQERGVLAKDADGQWFVAKPIKFENLPGQVDAVLEERIGRLEKELKEILTCASVEGERFTAEVVARVRQIEELRLAERLNEELDKQHRLIRVFDKTPGKPRPLHLYRFVHALFQQYLYDNLSGMQKQKLHQAVGETIEALYRDDIGDSALQLAHHFLEAHENAKAIKYFMMAGDRAKAVYANEDALHYYHRAREIIAQSRPDFIEQDYQVAQALAKIYALLGRANEQRDEIEKMFGLARALSDKRKLIDAYTTHARFLSQTGEYEQAQQAGKQALALAQKINNNLKKAGAWIAIGEACAFLDKHHEALTNLRAALRVYRQKGDKQNLAEAIRFIALVHLNRNDYSDAFKRAEEALALYRQISDRTGEEKTLRYIGDIYCGQGDYQKALDYYQEVLRIRREIGNRAREGGALGDIGDVYLFLGCYEKSLEFHLQSLAINQEVGYKYGQVWCHHDMGVIYCNMRNLTAARAELEKALKLANEIRAQNLIVLSKNDLSLTLRTLGEAANLALALQLAKEAADTGKRAALVYGQIVGHSYQAMAHLAYQQRAEALRFSRKAVTLLEKHGPAEVLEEEIFFNHSKILLAAGKVNEANRYLNKAYEEVNAKANKIKDPDLRQSFLTNIRVNHEIAVAWQNGGFMPK